MEAYSLDLRERVLADCDAGMGTKEVATKYKVSQSWVRGLKQKRRETGSIAPLPRSGGRPAIIVDQREERLKKLLEKCPDATLNELHRRLRLKCWVNTVYNAVVALGMSFKKSRFVRANKIGPM